MAVRSLTAIFCLLTMLQLTLPPTTWAQTAETAPGAAAPAGSLDLSSTTRDLSATASGTIQVGDGSRTIGVNDPLTAAEQLALFQVLSSGTQSIVLGANGNAVSGQFHIDPGLASGLQSIVVPEGVTGIQTATSLTLSGNFANYGSFYAVSTNPQNTTSYLAANNIFNYQGALLTSVLPTGGLAGFSNAISGLSLQLTAVNNIMNAGTISSANDLSIFAGGSIINALPQGITGAMPIMQAVNNVNLASNLGNIVNSGLIQSINANINVNVVSQMANNLVLNNIGGRLEALNGLINVRDSAFAGKFDTTIFGGDILAQALNINSGDGIVDLNVNKLLGTVNVNAGIAHLVANTDSLNIGAINLSGDPTFYNTLGDIVLRQDMSFSGQNLAIVAQGDVISDGAQIINTSSGNNGGTLTIIAGAAFNTSATGTPSVTPPSSPDGSSIITVLGPSAGGGKIDFATNPIAAISTVGGFNAGGNVTIVAYAGTKADSGTVRLPDITLTTGSGGTDLNGNVVIIAGAKTGTAIQMGSANTSGAANGSGNIFLLTNNASMTGCGKCTGNMQIVDGKIIAGAFNTDPNIQPSTTAGIIAGDLRSSGGAINLISGGNVNVANISTMGGNSLGQNGGVAIRGFDVNTATVGTSGGAIKIIADNVLTTLNLSSIGANYAGKNGGISLIAGAATGQALTAGDIITSGATAISGNVLVITSAKPATFCPTCALTARPTNTQGSVTLGKIDSVGTVDLRAGGDIAVSQIASQGAGSTRGGTVTITSNENNATANAFVIGGGGTNGVGLISVSAGRLGAGTIGITSGGSGGITVANQSLLNLQSPTSGSGGKIGLNAKSGTLTVDGDWNVNGVTQGNGGLVNLAGKTINFTSDVIMTANGAGNGNGGSLSITATDLNLPAGNAFLSANGSGTNGFGGSVTVSSVNSTNVGAGGITMSALGSGSGGGGAITFGSNGGVVNFNGGTVALNASSDDSLAGRIDIVAGTTLNVGSGLINAKATSITGGGGIIAIAAGTATTTTGTILADASAKSFSGGFIRLIANNITTGSGGITLAANSTDSYGGNIEFSANSITTGSGAVTSTANGGLGGGFITAGINSTNGNSNIAFAANAQGAMSGTGGTIYLSADNASSLALGSGGGQIGLSATGYSANGGPGDGGQTFISAGKNISLSGSGVNVSTSSANGSGGLIALAAGTSGQGVFQMNGSLSADGNGTGNGGIITFEYADNNPFNSVNTAGAPAVNVANISAQALGSGLGGTITVSNTNTLSGTTGMANNGSMNVASAGGTTGSINVLAAGGSTPTQDIKVSGSGTFNGIVNAVGRNVSFDLTNTAPIRIGEVRAVGGNLSVSAPTIELRDSNAVLASSGTTAITTSTLTNNSTIDSTGAMTMSNAGNISVAGTGIINAPTLTASSTSGAVAISQNKVSGIIAGTAGTAYSVTLASGDLTAGSVKAGVGNVSLVANGGNLTINDGAAITANLGNVLIQDNFSSGNITLRPNATITAFSNTGVTGTGQVYIVSGGVPSTPVAGSTPSNMTVNLTNGGSIYFGSAGITSQCCNQIANVDGSTSIVFNTNNPNSIILTTNNTINATNYKPTTPVAPLPPGKGGTPPGQGGLPPGLGGATNPGHGGTPPGQGGQIPGQSKPDAVTPTVVPVPTAAPLVPTAAPATVPKVKGKVAYLEDSSDNEELAELPADQEFVPVAFVQGGAHLAGKRAAEVFGTKTQTALIKQSNNSEVFMNAQQTVMLREGEMLVATERATTVKAGDCKIVVAPNAVVQLSAKDGTVKVRDLHDAGKDGVTITVGNHQSITLIAGQEAVVAISSSAKTAMSQDRVGRRRIRETAVPETNLAVATCEYSLLSLIDDSLVLQQMFRHGELGDSNIVDKVLKTAVALTSITSSHGVYSRVNP